MDRINECFPFQIRTRFTRSPTIWSWPRLVILAMPFNSPNTFRRIWLCTRCATATNWDRNRLLISHDEIWPTICAVRHRTTSICWLPATMRKRVPNCTTSITLRTRSRWTTPAKDTVASFPPVFSTDIGMQVSKVKADVVTTRSRLRREINQIKRFTLFQISHRPMLTTSSRSVCWRFKSVWLSIWITSKWPSSIRMVCVVWTTLRRKHCWITFHEVWRSQTDFSLFKIKHYNSATYFVVLFEILWKIKNKQHLQFGSVVLNYPFIEFCDGYFIYIFFSLKTVREN